MTLFGAVALTMAQASVGAPSDAPPIIVRGQEPLTVPIPQIERLAASAGYVLEQRENRTLPNGEHIVFHWTHHVHFADDATGLIAILSMINQHCVGPTSLCATFQSMIGAQNGIVRRFRIGFDATVAPVQALAHDRSPVSAEHADTAENVDRISAIVTAIENEANGVLGAAELRNLLIFAGRRLPALGEQGGDGASSGRDVMALIAVTARYADVRVTALTAGGDDPRSAMRSVADYRIDLETGLLQAATVRDFARGSDTVLRERMTMFRPMTPE